MGVPAPTLETARSNSLPSITPRPKADGIRTPIDGYEAEIDPAIEIPHYYDNNGRVIHDWKFIQRPVILTKRGVDEGVYLIEIKFDHCNLSAVLKDPDDTYRLEDEIRKIAALPQVKHLIVSLHFCKLVNGTSPDRLAGFFVNKKGFMENEHKHLSLVHVEDRLYDRLLKNHAIEHFTHTNVHDAIVDNGNFGNSLPRAVEASPIQSHLRLVTDKGDNNEATGGAIYYY